MLLDEIEKAHDDVYNILLQVLDDGRLTDNHGNTVDFTNTIIVMTSNIGSQVIQKITDDGGSIDEIREAVEQTLRARFLPELLNRIDEKIVFHPLSKSQIRKIADFQIVELGKRLAEQGYILEVSEAARERIAEEGYDPVYGARPLKRVLQQRIANPLATALLKHSRDDAGLVKIDYDGAEFTFDG